MVAVNSESPSSRRAWIEISSLSTATSVTSVALLAEGVDRNVSWYAPRRGAGASPSSRRAWIEIACHGCHQDAAHVALLAEGVDRNRLCHAPYRVGDGRPPRGGRG